MAPPLYRCFLCGEQKSQAVGWCERYGCSTNETTATFEIGDFTVHGNGTYCRVFRRGYPSGSTEQPRFAWVSIRLFSGMGIFHDRRSEVLATFGADILEEWWSTDDVSVFGKLERLKALE